MKKPLTRKQDDAFDRKNGIKENSAKDKALDKRLMGKKGK